MLAAALVCAERPGKIRNHGRPDITCCIRSFLLLSYSSRIRRASSFGLSLSLLTFLLIFLQR